MTSYKLGVVALAVMGVWFIAAGLTQVEFLMRVVEGGGGGVVSAVMYMLTPMGIGIALLLARERLAGFLLPRDEEDTDGPPLDDLLVSGLMIVGVCLCISSAWRVLRVVAHMVDNRGLPDAFWTDFAPDLLCIGVALLVFLRPEWVRDLGRRPRTGGTG